jgi:hypothetical protein
MPVILGRTAVEQRAHVPIAYATLLEPALCRPRALRTRPGGTAR